MSMSLPALSAILALGFFLLVAYLSRATVRRAAGAVVVAALVPPLVAAVDVAASSAKLWRYPGVATGYGPIGFYLAAGLGIGAVSLLIWRLARRFGARVYPMSIAFFALYGPARDYLASRLAPSTIEFSPGATPLLTDMLAWASGISLALLVMRLVAGPAGSTRARIGAGQTVAPRKSPRHALSMAESNSARVVIPWSAKANAYVARDPARPGVLARGATPCKPEPPEVSTPDHSE